MIQLPDERLFSVSSQQTLEKASMDSEVLQLMWMEFFSSI